jgi:23S rRNA (cytosine1962-C5)-methyltransferase
MTRTGRLTAKNLAVLTLSRSAADAVGRGHPWVFREGLVKPKAGLIAGEEVQLVVSDGTPLGRGLFDPDSAIAVRVWTQGSAAVDGALFLSRISRALELRAQLVASVHTNAYRLVHGEGDRMPGFVVDRYDDVAVMKVDGGAALARRTEIVSLLHEPLKAIGIRTLILREASRGAAPSSEVAFGPPPPPTIEVREHGIPFVVDLAKGQKTGAFLDQRENRRRVGALSSGRTVLNLFSYAGGFSLHAAHGGATRVTSVDIASAAHATAQESFRRSGLDPRAHDFASADAFAFLAEAAKKGRSWDLVISDPPSFAPNEKAVSRAIAAYRSLHRACARVLAPQGLLCASSCSSHIDATTFASTLDDASIGRDDLRLLEQHGPPCDHPTLPAWPEGRYLKFALLG